jgi:hypothetical protein
MSQGNAADRIFSITAPAIRAIYSGLVKLSRKMLRDVPHQDILAFHLCSNLGVNLGSCLL